MKAMFCSVFGHQSLGRVTHHRDNVVMHSRKYSLSKCYRIHIQEMTNESKKNLF